MSTTPSFASLYRQSRYARTDDSQQHATRQNRQELFAVASVAFLMEHDRAFRDVFLQQVCGVEKECLAEIFKIEIQPEFHADLRIFCPARCSLYIVEFKIGAKLEPKQDPSNCAAFLKEKTGYGWDILNWPEYKDFTKTYTVLQNFQFEEPIIPGLSIRSKTWKALVDNPATESSITRDLLDMLGGWGIPSLKFRHATKMKKAAQTIHATEIFQIISAIAEEIGIGSKQYKFDAQTDAVDGSYFGLKVPFRSKEFTKLEKLAGQHEDCLGWFGYSSGPDGTSSLDVWIYCKQSTAVNPPQNKVLRLVQDQMGTKSAGTSQVSEGHVRISIDGSKVEDDKEWFSAVFNALRDRP